MVPRALFLMCALVLVPGGSALSQTTIFNIPAADTLQRGSVNVEADLLAKPARYANGGYQTYGYRLAYGLTRNSEIGSNFYFTWDGQHSVADIEFSFKREVYKNERLGILSALGVTAFVPLRPATGDRPSFMVYGTAAKTFKKTGTQLTGGAYHVFRGQHGFGTRTGALLALVQPLHKRLNGVIDWFSGDNRFGYVSTGFTFSVTKRQYLTAGYSFGNSGRGNNALAVYYGIIY